MGSWDNVTSCDELIRVVPRGRSVQIGRMPDYDYAVHKMTWVLVSLLFVEMMTCGINSSSSFCSSKAKRSSVVVVNVVVAVAIAVKVNVDISIYEQKCCIRCHHFPEFFSKHCVFSSPQQKHQEANNEE